jgi:hypothetical protein
VILARLRRRPAALGLLIALLLRATTATAQTEAPADPAASGKVDIAKFLAGAGLGLLIHEGGHLAWDEIFDARPRVESVHFGPVPFCAITPTRQLSTRQLFTVASAGFWTQELSSELLQSPNRDLRHEHAPFAKGMLAFDVLTSVGYGVVAFAEAGPAQRDTRGMAAGLGAPEPAIGALIMAPAILDIYRYYRPDSRWAKWAMRALAAGSVVVLVRAPRTQSQ